MHLRPRRRQSKKISQLSTKTGRHDSSSLKYEALDNDAGEAPGVPAGRRRLGHATALDTGDLVLPFKLRLPIHHTSLRLHRGRLRSRQHADWLRYRYVVLLPISTAAGFGQAQIALRPGQ
jgi:hypothetical protein